MAEQNFNGTIGPLLLGTLCTAVLFGMSCIQAYTYYRTTSKDSLAFRRLILFLWCLETLHLALITHASYYYVVSNFDNVPATALCTWSIFAQMYMTPVITACIRAIFGRRVWLIYDRNIIFPGSIAMFSILALLFNFIFTSKVLKLVAFKYMPLQSHTLYPSFVFSFAADILIAAPLCIALLRCRTGLKNTGSDSVIRVVIMYTVNTCLLTTTCMAMVFVAFVVWPNTIIFIGVHFTFSQLYFNSLLATLNNREMLADKLNGIFFLGGTTTTQRANDSESDPRVCRRLSHLKFESVVININQEVEVDSDTSLNGKRNPIFHSEVSISEILSND